MRRIGGSRAFTLIELLVVIAILAILSTFIMGAIGGAKNKARVAIASSQIKSLATALEAYNTDVGFYPRDPANTAAGDIPHLLFAALNNKPTRALGGGPNSPYFDADNNGIGRLAGIDFRQTYDNNGQASGSGTLPGDNEEPFNANPIQPNENPSTATWQSQTNYTNAPVGVNLSTVNNYPVFIDPWVNSYHYREWQSKSEAQKESLATGGAADRIPHNFDTFDIWSNGPDGINNYGHPDSDDVSNWGR